MLPEKLTEIIEDFSYCEGQEKLEYLLDLSEQLPAMPERLEDKRADFDEVHECMSPVFIYPEVDGDVVNFHYDIPPEAPTVRGFAAVLALGVSGQSADIILSIPDDFYRQMGLHTVMTGQRLNGIGAILAHMKTLTKELTH